MTTPAPAGQTGYETTTYTYDAEGHLISTIAPPATSGGASQVTSSTYNTVGEVVLETTGAGAGAASTSSYCYDPNGNTTAVTYADGNINGIAGCESAYPWVVDSHAYPTQASFQTTYSYDSVNELVSTTTPVTVATGPSGGTTTETYDPAGSRLTQSNPDGVITTWTYTPLSKTATITYSGSSAHSVTNGYDANGSKTSMTDATGTSVYVFDPFGEIISATNGAGQTTGYGYNADGAASSVTYPLPATATWAASSTVSYAYDNADRLSSVTDFNGHQMAIGVTADGRQSSLALGSSGDSLITAYDPAGNESSISLKNGSSTLQSFTYSYSQARTILNEADTPAAPQYPAVYTYDAQSRITSMTPGSGSGLSYGYDASSNLTTLPNGSTGTYDNAGELTSSQGSAATTYSYDAAGQRLTAKQGSTIVSSGNWNEVGQLVSFNNNAANMTSASYDGDNLRSSTSITPAGKSANAEGYVWDICSQMPQLLMDSTNAYISPDSGTPAEQVNLSTGTITYLMADALGSVRATISSSGSVTGSTGYDAWGNPMPAGGLTVTTPFGFAGGYTDPTGLIYLINRYYDPQSGQFISADPILRDTMQPYAYADGNPVSMVDPTGAGATIWEQYETTTWGQFSLSACVTVSAVGFCAPFYIGGGKQWLGLWSSNWGRHSLRIRGVESSFDIAFYQNGIDVPSFRFVLRYNGKALYRLYTPRQIGKLRHLDTGILAWDTQGNACINVVVPETSVINAEIWGEDPHSGTRMEIHENDLVIYRHPY